MIGNFALSTAINPALAEELIKIKNQLESRVAEYTQSLANKNLSELITLLETDEAIQIIVFYFKNILQKLSSYHTPEEIFQWTFNLSNTDPFYGAIVAAYCWCLFQGHEQTQATVQLAIAYQVSVTQDKKLHLEKLENITRTVEDTTQAGFILQALGIPTAQLNQKRLAPLAPENKTKYARIASFLLVATALILIMGGIIATPLTAGGSLAVSGVGLILLKASIGVAALTASRFIVAPLLRPLVSLWHTVKTTRVKTRNPIFKAHNADTLPRLTIATIPSPAAAQATEAEKKAADCIITQAMLAELKPYPVMKITGPSRPHPKVELVLRFIGLLQENPQLFMSFTTKLPTIGTTHLSTFFKDVSPTLAREEQRYLDLLCVRFQKHTQR